MRGSDMGEAAPVGGSEALVSRVRRSAKHLHAPTFAAFRSWQVRARTPAPMSEMRAVLRLILLLAPPWRWG